MIPQIDVQDLAKKIQAGEPLFLLDVRQPWEHDLVFLSGSVLIPMGELSTRLEAVRSASDRLVVAYCHHGIRSLSAVAFLQREGIQAVSLRGGIDAWAVEVDPALPRY